MLADVVQRPDFAETEVARNRTRAVNALRVNLRQPGPLANLVLNRLAFGDAPYGTPSSGTPTSIGAITRDE
ncbi:MAG: insulinase family protein, partial [Brevundimonas sp.]